MFHQRSNYEPCLVGFACIWSQKYPTALRSSNPEIEKKNNLENFQVNLAFQLNQALIWTNPESHAGIDVSFQFILVYSNGNPIAISFLSPFFEG